MSDSIHRLDIEMLDHRVVVRGELDAFAAEQLSAALEPRLAGVRLVLDLTGVSFIDSSGLAVLVRARQSAEDQGGSIEVVPSPRVRRVIEIAGLGGHLHVDER